MPSNFSTRSTNHSSTSSVPATPMATTPSTHAADFQPAANLPAPRQPASNHTCTSHMDKWVINLSKTPLIQEQLSLLQKVPIMPSPPNTPHRSLHHFHRASSQQVTPQEADELRSDVNRILRKIQQHNKHCNLNPPSARPLQNSNKTSPWWFSQQTRGWPWSSWTNRTTQTKHKLYYRTPTPTKFSPKTPPPTLKTNSLPYSRTSSEQEAYPPKNINNSTPPVQSLPSSMASSKSIKQALPLDPLFPVGSQSPMELLRSFPTSSNP